MPRSPRPASSPRRPRRSSTRSSRSRARGSCTPSAPTACGTPPARCCASAPRPPRATRPRPANFPDEPAIIDELGTLTFKEVDERTNALAHALAADGIGAGDGVAIMCRNHRGWIDAVLACSKLGANALFLNTAFSGPQLTDVAKREKPKAVDLRPGVRRGPQGRRARAASATSPSSRRQDQGPDARGPDRAAATPRRWTRPASRAARSSSPRARPARRRARRARCRSRSTRSPRCCP